MAQDYPLEEFSPRAFEQLTVALSIAAFGPGVEAFGSGPDGGREATFHGRIDWSEEPGDDTIWDGYTVIQAKHREHHSPHPADNLNWLTKQISAELDAWTSPDSLRRPVPDYLLFVTNVRLSSVPGAGIDRLREHLTARLRAPIAGDTRVTLSAMGVKGIRVWHRDQINGFLTTNASIRNAFKALLTVGDLLERLTALTGTLDPQELYPVLRAHAQNGLTAERWVNLQEAGGTSRESVENIIIDLAATNEDERRSTVLSEVFTRSAAVLKRSIADREQRPHIVLTGSAGSGKSTISKFLTQAFRARFTDHDALLPTPEEVRNATEDALRTLESGGPVGHRWPVLVRLTDFADALGPSGDLSLLRFLAQKVSGRAEVDLKPHALKKWLTYWPCVVILDGLDEVTAPEVRPRVLDAITHFLELLESDDADLMVIVTTRPTGYTERLMPHRFQQLDLIPLDRPTAERYGRIVTTRRLKDDPDRRDNLLKSFDRQLRLSTMQRLMKTPLQVLIMTIILERVGTLPADRYQLFSQYFDTMYTRESGKPTTLAPLLSTQDKTIVHLHEAVGRILHTQAETRTGARSVLPRSELRTLLDDRLRDLGHDEDRARTQIGDRIMRAATERLVLLVPAEHDGFAFEVRSLQELMAARALVKADDATLRERLTALAPSPHWRATWVFMAGYVFSHGTDAQREMVVQIIEHLDSGDTWPGWLSPIGPELAATLLDDGLAAQTPKWLRRLVHVALRGVGGPPPVDIRVVADGLTAAASADPSMHSYIRNTLKHALHATPRASFASLLLLSLTELNRGISAEYIRSGTEPIHTDATIQQISIGEYLRTHLDDLPDSDNALHILAPLLDALTVHRVAQFGSGEYGLAINTTDFAAKPPIADLIDDPAVSSLTELLLAALPPQDWRVAHGLSILYARDAGRRPVPLDPA